MWRAYGEIAVRCLDRFRVFVGRLAVAKVLVVRPDGAKQVGAHGHIVFSFSCVALRHILSRFLDAFTLCFRGYIPAYAVETGGF